jgi:hypothetical protein
MGCGTSANNMDSVSPPKQINKMNENVVTFAQIPLPDETSQEVLPSAVEGAI